LANFGKAKTSNSKSRAATTTPISKHTAIPQPRPHWVVKEGSGTNDFKLQSIPAAFEAVWLLFTFSFLFFFFFFLT
jgi:hypothetical protein